MADAMVNLQAQIIAFSQDYQMVMIFMLCAIPLAMILVGSIYPAISLWLLSRPGARAACAESGKAPGLDGTW